MPLYFTIKRKLNPLWAISFDNEKFPKNSKNSDRLIKIFPSTSINNRFPFPIPRHNRRTTSSDQLLQNVEKMKNFTLKDKSLRLKNSIIVENHPAHFQQHSKPWFGRRATRADRWSNRKFRKFQRIVGERASFAAISRECPTHIRPPCFETRRCRNENRFSSRCSALSTPLLRGEEARKLAWKGIVSLSCSLFVRARGWKSITYHCSNPCRQDLMVCFSTSWLDFFPYSFKGWTPVSNLVSSFIFAFYSNWSVDALFHDLLRKILITSKFDCSAFWAVLYDILKSRNGRTIIKRGDWDILFAFESFSR